MLTLVVAASALVVQPCHLGGAVHNNRAATPVMQFDLEFWQPKKASAEESEESTSESDDEKEEKKKGIDLAGLAQLMTMGAGAPSLGEFTGMEDNKMMFELGEHCTHTSDTDAPLLCCCWLRMAHLSHICFRSHVRRGKQYVRREGRHTKGHLL